MINWWGFTLQDYKRGVLGTAGQVKKRGPRHGSGQKEGSWARVRYKKRGLRHVSGKKRGLRHGSGSKMEGS